jgi:hypothetical protein
LRLDLPGFQNVRPCVLAAGIPAENTGAPGGAGGKVPKLGVGAPNVAGPLDGGNELPPEGAPNVVSCCGGTAVKDVENGADAENEAEDAVVEGAPKFTPPKFEPAPKPDEGWPNDAVESPKPEEGCPKGGDDEPKPPPDPKAEPVLELGAPKTVELALDDPKAEPVLALDAPNAGPLLGFAPNVAGAVDEPPNESDPDPNVEVEVEAALNEEPKVVDGAPKVEVGCSVELAPKPPEEKAPKVGAAELPKVAKLELLEDEELLGAEKTKLPAAPPPPKEAEGAEVDKEKEEVEADEVAFSGVKENSVGLLSKVTELLLLAAPNAVKVVDSAEVILGTSPNGNAAGAGVVPVGVEKVLGICELKMEEEFIEGVWTDKPKAFEVGADLSEVPEEVEAEEVDTMVDGLPKIDSLSPNENAGVVALVDSLPTAEPKDTDVAVKALLSFSSGKKLTTEVAGASLVRLSLTGLESNSGTGTPPIVSGLDKKLDKVEVAAASLGGSATGAAGVVKKENVADLVGSTGKENFGNAGAEGALSLS